MSGVLVANAALQPPIGYSLPLGYSMQILPAWMPCNIQSAAFAFGCSLSAYVFFFVCAQLQAVFIVLLDCWEWCDCRRLQCLHQAVSDIGCKVCLTCCRYVYQKAYVEFFVSPEKLDDLEQRLQKQSSITYMAINSKGTVRSPTHPLAHVLFQATPPSGRSYVAVSAGGFSFALCFSSIGCCCSKQALQQDTSILHRRCSGHR